MALNKLLYPPTQNGLQKTLDSALNTGVTASMTLNNITSIDNKPGVCVIDRIDSTGVEKLASAREYIMYTGTSGSTLTGLTRGLGGSTDQDHGVGAVVEFVPDVNVFLEIVTALAGLVDATDTTSLNSAIVTLTGAQTLTNKVLDVITGTSQFPKVHGIKDLGTVGATETVDWVNGDRQKMTLDENLTITFSNAVEGQTLTLYMLQDGTGTNTITFADTLVYADATTPTYTTAAGKMNIVVVTYIGGAYYAVANKFA